jgi:hypothetical protein
VTVNVPNMLAWISQKKVKLPGPGAVNVCVVWQGPVQTSLAVPGTLSVRLCGMLASLFAKLRVTVAPDATLIEERSNAMFVALTLMVTAPPPAGGWVGVGGADVGVAVAGAVVGVGGTGVGVAAAVVAVAVAVRVAAALALALGLAEPGDALALVSAVVVAVSSAVSCSESLSPPHALSPTTRAPNRNAAKSRFIRNQYAAATATGCPPG